MPSDEKSGVAYGLEVDSSDNSARKWGNAADRRDMDRMGKSQQLKRDYKQVTIFSFSLILVATWETVFAAAGIGLTNGGSAGFIYMYIVVWIAFLCIYTSMAQMASMAPTSGGQYHWVSEFASPKYQKLLSYVVGWLGVLGWQVSVSSVGYFVGTEIQGLAVLNYPNYDFQRWHSCLLLIASVVLAAVFNIFLSRLLPVVEAIIAVLHIGGFIGISAVLWTMSPLSTPTQIFTEFSNPGWNSVGTSCLVGILAPILTMLGTDSVVHMAEEVQDASYALPRAMFWACFLNGVLGLEMVIALCFTIGDIGEVLSTKTGYVFIQVFYNTTESLAATNGMSAIVIIIAFFSCITIMASASRQLFAFARDNGLPFSAWLAHVTPGYDLPINSIYVSVIFALLLSLIIIGSTAAFNSLTSLGAVAIMASYTVSIACLLWARWSGRALPQGKFELGRFGDIIAVFALASLVVMFIFSFFPGVPLPALTVVSMNWSSLIFGALCLWGVVYYFLYARKIYEGPVLYVKCIESQGSA